MKKITLLIALTFVLNSLDSFGQLYESVYATSNDAIRSKIDQNKIAGLDKLSGINADHLIGIVGLSISQKHEIESMMTANSNIISFVFHDDLNSIFLKSYANLTKLDIEAFLNTFNITITGYSVEYFLNEQ